MTLRQFWHEFNAAIKVTSELCNRFITLFFFIPYQLAKIILLLHAKHYAKIAC